jgi:hypothetical protein
VVAPRKLPTFNPYGLVRPCKLCPFRTDVEPYLRPSRVTEIEQSILGGAEFPCHETTGAKTGKPRPRSEHVHCAGALILMENNGRASQMMRIAERLGLYDARKLDGDAPVYESFLAMRRAQPRIPPKPAKRKKKA